ncbi:MAG: AMP-binding protein [Steroidobacteraceae bacterium]|nr:AMP-binding protein [Steroidobacteraceae bacterium]
MNHATGHAALENGRRRLGADELAGLVSQERTWLASLAGGDARHALLADNGIGWAVADLALHAARAVNVPLPGYFTPAQVEHALATVGVDVILTDDAPRVLDRHDGWRVLRASPASGLVALGRSSPAATRPSLPAGTTKVTFTSGSTGTPKGVCLGADAIESVARSLAGVIAPLGVTRHLCLLPLATLLDELAALVAAPLAGLLAAVHRGWRPPPTLRFVAVGGAAVSPELLAEARRRGVPAFEGYGLSECASVVALSAPQALRPGSVGRVLPHARVRVDAHGELHVRGAVMLGYLGAGGAEALPDGEVATGDLGRIDADGFVYVEGRAKNMLITSLGRNVSPEWVERELLAQPAIGQALVFGDARPWLFALLVPSGAAVTAAELTAAVAQANRGLPEYAQVRRWQMAPAPFSVADGSLTANGRPRRDVLLARHAALLDAAYAEPLAS